MNKENLQRLIKSIEEGQFSALDVNHCFGGHCAKLLDNSVYAGSWNVKEFLDMSQVEATALFVGKDTEGNLIFEGLTLSPYELAPSEKRKQEALAHLRKLMVPGTP